MALGSLRWYETWGMKNIYNTIISTIKTEQQSPKQRNPLKSHTIYKYKGSWMNEYLAPDQTFEQGHKLLP